MVGEKSKREGIFGVCGLEEISTVYLDSEDPNMHRGIGIQARRTSQIRTEMSDSSETRPKTIEHAIELYFPAAMRGLAEAQYAMGKAFSDLCGDGRKEAAQCYLRAEARETKLPDGFGESIERDDHKSVQAYWHEIEFPSAQHESPDVNYSYQASIDGGLCLGSCDREAVAWYERAADQAHARATCALGVCMETGTGCKRDVVRAEALYRRCIAGGSIDAQLRLAGLLYNTAAPNWEIDWYFYASDEARDLCHLAANGGSPWAQTLQGYVCEHVSEHAKEMLRRGDRAFEKTYPIPLDSQVVGHLCDAAANVCDIESAFWFQRAAEQDYGPALFALANCYKFGCGVSLSIGRTAQLFAASAAKGFTDAFRQIAWHYEHGIGVALDEQRARAYYQDAAQFESEPNTLRIWSSAGRLIYDEDVQPLHQE